MYAMLNIETILKHLITPRMLSALRVCLRTELTKATGAAGYYSPSPQGSRIPP